MIIKGDLYLQAYITWSIFNLDSSLIPKNMLLPSSVVGAI
jgi:hypothetical protein